MSESETTRLLEDGTRASPRLQSQPFSKHQIQHDQEIDSNAYQEDSTVGRTLGWGSCYVLVISRVIGSGIFAMPGTIVQNVGSPGLALTLWIVGALVAWAGLAIDMEYGTMLPRSGGMKVYLEYAYQKPRFLASTLVAVHAVLLGFTASNCIVFAKYTLFATGFEPTDLAVKLLAVGLLTVITVIHGGFRQAGILIQNALGWLKIGLIIFMIFTGLFVVILRPDTSSSVLSQSSARSESWKLLWQDSEWGWNNLTTAFLKIFYSYAGLSNINNVLNEVKDPVRTVKTVGPAALLTACVMYLLINVSYLAVVPLDDIKSSKELIAGLFFERVFGTGFGDVVLPLAVALSAAGNVMVVTFSLARVNQEIARQGFMPYASLLASSKPFGAPLGGLIVHYIPSILVITLPPTGSVYAFIADVEGYSGQLFAFALGVGLLILRTRKPDIKRPFKAWLPVVWLRIALCVSLIAAPLFPPRKGTADVSIFYATYALIGYAILLVSIVYWYVWTIALPQNRGYRLEEEADILSDGTTITKLVRHGI